MASGHSEKRKATNTYQKGTNWSNIANVYDNSDTTYAVISQGGSACHINKFGFNLPTNAIVEKVDVYFKVSTSNSNGYFAGYLYSNVNKTIAYEIFVENATQSTKGFTLSVTADTIQSKLNSLGIYDGNILTYLKDGLKIRWVGGNKSGSTSSSKNVTCKVYDNYVTVYYALPDYTVTFTNSDGTVLQTQTVEYGTTPTYTGPTPTKTPDERYYYEFAGWDKNITAVTGDVTYTAKFNSIYQKYTITVNMGEGGKQVTGGGTYTHGTGVVLTATPLDGYVFLKWNDNNLANPRTVPVTGNVTYTAYFKLNKIYIGTEKPSKIYVDKLPVKAIYIDTTKVYG